MNAPSATETQLMPSFGTLRAIFVGGVAAGALDILYAIGTWGLRGVTPARVLQGVASGLTGGEAAVNGGLVTAALGLGLHFFICLVAAAIYCAASLRFPFLVRRALFSGLVFGLLMYVAMNYVVVPLSAASFGPPSGMNIVIALFPHLAFVGPPIAFAARRAARAAGRLGPGFAG